MILTLRRGLLPLLGAVLLAGCAERFGEEPPQPAGSASVTFSLDAVAAEFGTAGPAVRSQELREDITALRYALLDAGGRLVEHRWTTLSEDLGSLTLEGLRDGRYSIVFFATTDADTTGFRPALREGRYLLESPQGALLDRDCLFARMEFEAGAESSSNPIPVALMRCVGCVEVAVKAVDPYTEYLIEKVEVSFDENSEVALCKTDRPGEYDGLGPLPMLDLTAKRHFYSLPSQGTLSGRVTVTSSRDGEPVVNAYRFEGLGIEPGKRAVLTVDWKSPVSDRGFFRVFESDYTEENSGEIFGPDEPREVFYDEALRSFSTDRPLQVRVNDRQELWLKYYSPIDLSDVTILCRFKRYSPEFFPLARYEKVPGFSESRMRIPLADRAQTFTSKDGRSVVIPAQPGLADDECEFRIVCDHPYMQKVDAIEKPIYVRYAAYSANNPDPGNWRNMTPALCRQGAVLLVNMSYMFNSAYFADYVTSWAGTDFLDGNGTSIPRDVVIGKARGISRLVLGAVGGVGGLGGGSTYGLAPYCYTGHYWDTEGKYSYAKEAIFHEFAHCMGYNHSGTMTYGGAWVNCVREVWYELGRMGQLPVSNSAWETNYP